MPRNRFPTPWDSSPEIWDEMGISDVLSFPGLSDGCAAPKLGVAPVIHRFTDIFIDTQQIPYPEMPDAGTLHSPSPANEAGPKECGIQEDFCDRNWQVRRPLSALTVSYEQAWLWKGNTLGEHVESISLTPGEQLEVQVYTWDRSKLSQDLQSTDLVDKRTESSLTMHDSAHVVNRMEKQKQWQLGANVGFSSGITAGIEASFSGGMSDVVERRRETRQEQTRKTAQQVRSERQLKVSTTRETGYEERRKRVLKNENPDRTVTYNFYETVAHYRVEIALTESQTAIAIPNRLPVISPSWIVCHEGILRDHLLDETQESGFEAARLLVRPEQYNLVAEAARRLCVAFQRQPVMDAAGERRDSFLERQFRNVAGGVPGPSEIPSDLEFQNQVWVTLRTFLEGDPPVHATTYLCVRDFLMVVREHPTVDGLKRALWLLSGRLYQWSGFYYPISPELEAAIGYATGVLMSIGPQSDEIPPAPGGMEGGMNLPESESGGSPETAQTTASPPDYDREAREARESAQALFDGMKCHIEHHLLHYMRPIWLAEDPEVRLRRHAHELGWSSVDFVQFVKQPLLGFHLNCCVYPSEPVDSESLVLRMSRNSKELQSLVDTHLKSAALRRFENSGRQILSLAVDRAADEFIACEKKTAALSPDDLSYVLKRVGEQVATTRDNVANHQGWQHYLSPIEKNRQVSLESQADAWNAAANELQQASENGLITDIPGFYASLTESWRDQMRKQDFKSQMISLPDGGYHCEPVVGNCSSIDKFRSQQLDADIRRAGAEADLAVAEAERLRKRVDELDASELQQQTIPTVRVQLTNEE